MSNADSTTIWGMTSSSVFAVLYFDRNTKPRVIPQQRLAHSVFADDTRETFFRSLRPTTKKPGNHLACALQRLANG